MTRRTKIWLLVTVIFNIVNLAGAVYAAVMGELLHAGAHVALLPPGGWLMWRLASRRSAAEAAISRSSGEFPDSLTNLEQSIDAVAIELERIGESQRFMTRHFAEQDAQRAPGAAAAEPIVIKPDRSSS